MAALHLPVNVHNLSAIKGYRSACATRDPPRWSRLRGLFKASMEIPQSPGVRSILFIFSIPLPFPRPPPHHFRKWLCVVEESNSDRTASILMMQFKNLREKKKICEMEIRAVKLRRIVHREDWVDSWDIQFSIMRGKADFLKDSKD